MNYIVKTLLGSRGYGLAVPDSDFDRRGVFIHTEVSKIIGLQRFDHQNQKVGENDEVYYEVRHFLNQLKSGNTTALELLFCERVEEFTIQWQLIRNNAFQLMDAKKIFDSLRGYMFGERRLMNGERTGQLGGKRKEALDKFGYSPKNGIQLIRLAWAGKILFQKGYFPVNVKKEDENLAQLLLDIKTNPTAYSVEQINALADKAEKELIDSFEQRKFNYHFEEEVAEKLVLDIYFPRLQECKLS